MLHVGDCLDILPRIAGGSVDAVVTDPPYSLAFMGREWDKFSPSEFQAWCEKWAAECLRVLKPGGHLVAFGGTRTYHRLACAVEDAGFEIRDSLHWLYGSGFPKSLDVGKAIDKRRDDYPAIRLIVEFLRAALDAAPLTRKELEDAFGGGAVVAHFLAPSCSNAICPSWDQWLQLKDLLGFGDEMDAEVWRLNGRKRTPGEAWSQREVIGTKKAIPGVAFTTTGPTELDVTAPATDAARQWDGWGTALKPAHEPIILARKPLAGTVAGNVLAHGTGALNIDGCRVSTSEHVQASASGGVPFGDGNYLQGTGRRYSDSPGRWPPNVLLGPDAAAELDRQSGNSRSTPGIRRNRYAAVVAYSSGNPRNREVAHDDEGGASRFFPVFRYQAKAPASERPRLPDGTAHPTVKPLALMRWLVRLITPPGGLVLDPFAGTGTTAEAAILEGFRYMLIEKDPASAELIRRRLSKPLQRGLEGLPAS